MNLYHNKNTYYIYEFLNLIYSNPIMSTVLLILLFSFLCIIICNFLQLLFDYMSISKGHHILDLKISQAKKLVDKIEENIKKEVDKGNSFLE